jgi:hypothetical protein
MAMARVAWRRRREGGPDRLTQLRESGGNPSRDILKQAQLQSEARGSTSIRFSGIATFLTGG